MIRIKDSSGFVTRYILMAFAFIFLLKIDHAFAGAPTIPDYQCGTPSPSFETFDCTVHPDGFISQGSYLGQPTYTIYTSSSQSYGSPAGTRTRASHCPSDVWTSSKIYLYRIDDYDPNAKGVFSLEGKCIDQNDPQYTECDVGHLGAKYDAQGTCVNNVTKDDVCSYLCNEDNRVPECKVNGNWTSGSSACVGNTCVSSGVPIANCDTDQGNTADPEHPLNSKNQDGIATDGSHGGGTSGGDGDSDTGSVGGNPENPCVDPSNCQASGDGTGAVSYTHTQCGEPEQCDGDPVLCASVAYQKLQYCKSLEGGDSSETNTKLDNLNNSVNSSADKIVNKLDDVANKIVESNKINESDIDAIVNEQNQWKANNEDGFFNGETFDLDSYFKETSILGSGGGTCPAPETFTVMGKVFYIKYDLFCDFAIMISYLVMAFSYFKAYQIMFRGN
ncbi:hypothetical protein tloyanaT_20990 [Thalassotalea loyana]|uniref:Uncharacterized protein n=1 Tax=Thalassotalea loyana TaxID=280483 RepID=A0ABQ6HGK3_9GAMM|nr:virulence factor TspB C-terminal domain-related protein [Thalassotalea loyana]GLX85847.1 hypothetical protein tloyanaT_20990 [Thalassotalea loyana]